MIVSRYKDWSNVEASLEVFQRQTQTQFCVYRKEKNFGAKGTQF